jgi:hypothetical protein
LFPRDVIKPSQSEGAVTSILIVDGLGQIGTETTINSADLAGILMIAVQALEKRTAELKQKEAQLAVLESKLEELKAKHVYFETVAARLEAPSCETTTLSR